MTPLLVSTNLTDLSATIAIGSTRYEYFFATHARLHTLEWLFNRWSLKALNYAKRNCLRWEKCDARLDKEVARAGSDEPAAVRT